MGEKRYAAVAVPIKISNIRRTPEGNQFYKAEDKVFGAVGYGESPEEATEECRREMQEILDTKYE